MSTIDELLTIDKVRTWARQRPLGMPVGHAGTSSECPLANYLNETDPEHTYEVDESRIQIDGEGRIITPDWCALLVRLVDTFGFEQVIASEFLSILDEVAREVRE